MDPQQKQLAEWLQAREDKLIKVAADCAEAGLESASKYAWEEVSKIQELQIELAKCMELAGKPVIEAHAETAEAVQTAKDDCLIWLRKILDKSYMPIGQKDYHVHPDLIEGAETAINQLHKVLYERIN